MDGLTVPVNQFRKIPIQTVVFACLVAFFSCRSTIEPIKPTEFQDPRKRFEVTIPGQNELKVTELDESRLFEFTIKNDEGEAVALIRINVITKQDPRSADLFDAGYESRYLAKCRCTILETGIVNFRGKPARHYRISLRNGEWIGYQRHITDKNQIFIIGVSGPLDKEASIAVTFRDTLSSFMLKEE